MYTRPAGFGCKKIIYLAYPTRLDLWRENLEPAQAEFMSLVNKLSAEKLVLLFCDQAQAQKFSGPNITCKIIPYGDIWLRDTLPIFVKNLHGETLGLIPKFNGWGSKYVLEHDLDLAMRVARELEIKIITSNLYFEGGSIESNGAGVIITTEECLLNPNRNPNISKHEIEGEFAEIFGAKQVIWLTRGLLNDHTDGHVDNIARFITPNKISIMLPDNQSDPNYQVLLDIKNQLSSKFDLVCLPSPGCVLNHEDKIMPASYLNFIITPSVVIMPSFGVPNDQKAREILAKYFSQPVVSLSAKAILSGGGAFHCMSQDYFYVSN